MYQAKHAAKSPREISKKKRKSSSVLQAAGMLTVMMALSRILGFVRDISVVPSVLAGKQMLIQQHSPFLI